MAWQAWQRGAQAPLSKGVKMDDRRTMEALYGLIENQDQRMEVLWQAINHLDKRIANLESQMARVARQMDISPDVIERLAGREP